MASVQNFAVTAGEDQTLTMTARDGTGAVIDLTSAGITFRVMGKSGGTVLSKTGTALVAASGTFTVSLTDADTSGFKDGNYTHEALVTVSGVTTKGVSGRIRSSGQKAILSSASQISVEDTDHFYNLVSDVTAATIRADISWLSTAGYYSVGDGGEGFYKRVGAVPSHGAYITSNGGTAYWELYLSDVVNVKACGAKGDGTTDDANAIQAAINAINVAGGGQIFVPSGTYVIGTTLTVYSGTSLRGAHMNTAILKAKASLNAAIVRSSGYASLTGQNKWLVSDGVQHGIAFEELQFDGNKANQSSGNGIDLYAKRIFFKNVIIRDAKDIGLVSEAGANAGQTDWYDIPEGCVGPLWIRNCGSHGWQMRGPHDTVIEQLDINACGGDGLRIEYSGSAYNGICDISFAHIYANTGYGIYSNAPFKAKHLISESNYNEGAYIDGDHAHIGMLELYTNCRSTGSYELNIPSTAARINIGSVNIRNFTSAYINGIKLAGDRCKIGLAQISGSASQAIGVEIISGADFNYINANIDGFSGTGGTGLKTNSGGACSYTDIHARIDNCKTLWNNAAIGQYGSYKIRGFADTGQTFFTGSGPNTTDSRERWDIMGSDVGGTTYLSEIRKTSGFSVDLNTTAEQQFTMACSELMGLTPEPEDVTVALYYTGTNTTFAIQYIKLHATSSTLLSFYVKLSTAAGTAATANLIVTARL